MDGFNLNYYRTKFVDTKGSFMQDSIKALMLSGYISHLVLIKLMFSKLNYISIIMDGNITTNSISEPNHISFIIYLAKHIPTPIVLDILCTNKIFLFLMDHVTCSPFLHKTHTHSKPSALSYVFTVIFVQR